MALKSIKYETVEIYPTCPDSIRGRFIKGLLLSATKKGLEPLDLLKVEAENLSRLSNDVIHIYLTNKNNVIVALAGTNTQPKRENTRIAQVTFSTISK